VFKLECTAANDGDEGDITSFRLDSVELSTYADGNVTNAPVVVQVDGAKLNGSNLKGNTGKALAALARAIAAIRRAVLDLATPKEVETVGEWFWLPGQN